jgi:positive regulator of sigma E activity
MKNIKYVVIGLFVAALLIYALLFDIYFILEIILVIAFIIMTWAAYVLVRNLDKEYKNSKQ